MLSQSYQLRLDLKKSLVILRRHIKISTISIISSYLRFVYSKNCAKKFAVDKLRYSRFWHQFLIKLLNVLKILLHSFYELKKFKYPVAPIIV